MGRFGNLEGFGTGLFNDVSKGIHKQLESLTIEYININNLVASPKNKGLALDNIDELADSIMTAGVLEPLIVVDLQNDNYEIQSGHRRLQAIKQNLKKDKNVSELVPCIVFDLEKISLPVSDDMKKEYILNTANSNTRQLTDDNIITMKAFYDELYNELKEQGYSELGRKREFVASMINVSPSAIKRVQTLENIANKEILGKVSDGKIGVELGTEIAKLPTKQQKKVLKEIDAGKTPILKELKKGNVEAKNVKEENKDITFQIGKPFLKEATSQIDDLSSFLEKSEEISLTQYENRQAETQVKIIQNALTKLSNLLHNRTVD